MISGIGDGTFRVWKNVKKKNFGDLWLSKTVLNHVGNVYTVQVFSDGRIVTGGEDRKIHIRTESPNCSWSEKILDGHTSAVFCIQLLPDGQIVSGSADDTIRFWSRNINGSWNTKVLECSFRFGAFHVLPDDCVIYGCASGKIYRATEIMEGIFTQELLADVGSQISCIQALPDGSIVCGTRNGIFFWMETFQKRIDFGKFYPHWNKKRTLLELTKAFF